MSCPCVPWGAQHGVPRVGAFSISQLLPLQDPCLGRVWQSFGMAPALQFPDGNGDGDKGMVGVRLRGHREEQPQCVPKVCP